MTNPTAPHDEHADAPAAPTPEQVAARAAKANRATRGAMAGVLGLEALIVLLLPRAIAFTSSGLGLTRTLILVVLAVLMIAAAGLLRRPFGIATGSALQVLFVLTGIMLSAMFIVGVIFAAIWGRLLTTRHELVGTPGGWRMLIS